MQVISNLCSSFVDYTKEAISNLPFTSTSVKKTGLCALAAISVMYTGHIAQKDLNSTDPDNCDDFDLRKGPSQDPSSPCHENWYQKLASANEDKLTDFFNTQQHERISTQWNKITQEVDSYTHINYTFDPTRYQPVYYDLDEFPRTHPKYYQEQPRFTHEFNRTEIDEDPRLSRLSKKVTPQIRKFYDGAEISITKIEVRRITAEETLSETPVHTDSAYSQKGYALINPSQNKEPIIAGDAWKTLDGRIGFVHPSISENADSVNLWNGENTRTIDTIPIDKLTYRICRSQLTTKIAGGVINAHSILKNDTVSKILPEHQSTIQKATFYSLPNYLVPVSFLAHAKSLSIDEPTPNHPSCTIDNLSRFLILFHFNVSNT